MWKTRQLFAAAAVVVAATFEMALMPRALASATPLQITKFSKFDAPSDASGLFGHSLDALDGIALVGSADGNAFTYDVASGREIRRFLGDDTRPNNSFGQAVSMSRDYAVVGTFQLKSAYVFNIHTGQQIHKFAVAPGVGESSFGNSVAVSGDTVAIGDYADTTRGFRAGAVHLYRISTGERLRTLYSPSINPGFDGFGASVSVDGEFLTIGAPGVDENNLGGAVYVYNVSSGRLLKTLAPIEYGSRFGGKTKVVGSRVLVGSTNAIDFRDGAAFLFDLNTGEQLHRFVSPNLSDQGFFGSAIAYDGKSVLVGSWQETVNGVYDVGGAHLYDGTSGKLVASLLPEERANFTNAFGYGVALTGNDILASSFLNDGTVFRVRIPEPSTAALTALGAVVCVALSRRRRRFERGSSRVVKGSSKATCGIITPPPSPAAQPRLSWR